MKLHFAQILTQIIAFLVLVWVFKRYAWKPFQGILEERHQRIRAEFDLIDKQKGEIQALADQYEKRLSTAELEARAKIQAALEHGNRVAQEIQTEAQRQAAEVLKKAHADLDLELNKARMQLKNECVSLVMAATRKILQERIDLGTQKELIADSIEQVESR